MWNPFSWYFLNTEAPLYEKLMYQKHPEYQYLDLVQEILDRGLTETEDLVQAFIALDSNVYGWGDVQIIRERKLASAIQAGNATMDLGGLTQTITGPHWQWVPLKQKLRWSEE